jgi:hypothetical protein
MAKKLFQKETANLKELLNLDSLPSCVVHHSNGWKSIGMLYFKNKRVVVLLNHLSGGVDLGKIKNFRNKHIEPEASIMIIPHNKVTAIEIIRWT